MKWRNDETFSLHNNPFKNHIVQSVKQVSGSGVLLLSTSISFYRYIAVGEVTLEIERGNCLLYSFLTDTDKCMCYVFSDAKLDISKLYMRSQVDIKLIDSTILSVSWLWKHWILCQTIFLTLEDLYSAHSDILAKGKATVDSVCKSLWITTANSRSSSQEPFTCYWTRMFIDVFTRARLWTLSVSWWIFIPVSLRPLCMITFAGHCYSWCRPRKQPLLWAQ
jgi:hypothetical protein